MSENIQHGVRLGETRYPAYCGHHLEAGHKIVEVRLIDDEKLVEAGYRVVRACSVRHHPNGRTEYGPSQWHACRVMPDCGIDWLRVSGEESAELPEVAKTHWADALDVCKHVFDREMAAAGKELSNVP